MSFNDDVGGTVMTVGMDRLSHEIVLRACGSVRNGSAAYHDRQWCHIVKLDCERYIWESLVWTEFYKILEFFFAIKYFWQRQKPCVVVKRCSSPNCGAIRGGGIALSLSKVEELPELERHNPKRFADSSFKILMWQVPSGKWYLSTFVSSAFWLT